MKHLVKAARKRQMLNSEHQDFHKQVLGKVQEAAIPELSSLTTVYESTITEEDAVNKPAQKMAQTAIIADLRKKRRQIALSIMNHVDADTLAENDVTKKQSADKVKIYCDLYRSDIWRGYHQESDAIDNFIKDLKFRLSSEVTTLGLTPYITALEQAEQELQAAYNSRLADITIKKNLEKLKVLRKATDEAYDQLIARFETILYSMGYTSTIIAASENGTAGGSMTGGTGGGSMAGGTGGGASMGGSSSCLTLARTLNAIIDEYRRAIALRDTLNKKKAAEKVENENNQSSSNANNSDENSAESNTHNQEQPDNNNENEIGSNENENGGVDDGGFGDENTPSANA